MLAVRNSHNNRPDYMLFKRNNSWPTFKSMIHTIVSWYSDSTRKDIFLLQLFSAVIGSTFHTPPFLSSAYLNNSLAS